MLCAKLRARTKEKIEGKHQNKQGDRKGDGLGKPYRAGRGLNVSYLSSKGIAAYRTLN